MGDGIYTCLDCGHTQPNHYSSACESFTCCNRIPNRTPGKSGAEHDYGQCGHDPVRCKCDGFKKAEPPTMYGLTPGISDDTYHADRETLSSSGARRLLSCPARFKYEQDNPPASRPALDFGRVAHNLVLGEGGQIQVVDATDWRSKAAQQQRDACYAAGVTPVLKSDYANVQALRDSVMDHPTAGALFNNGMAELSGYWKDEQTGVSLRFRPDWLTELDWQPVCVDLKTTISADPREFTRSVAKYGYHAQAAWYLDGLAAHGVTDARFLFVAVEKTAPYPVSVVELDQEAIAEGRRLNRAAIDLYARCVREDSWPSYGDLIHSISLPSWAFRSPASQ